MIAWTQVSETLFTWGTFSDQYHALGSRKVSHILSKLLMAEWTGN